MRNVERSVVFNLRVSKFVQVSKFIYTVCNGTVPTYLHFFITYIRWIGNLRYDHNHNMHYLVNISYVTHESIVFSTIYSTSTNNVTVVKSRNCLILVHDSNRVDIEQNCFHLNIFFTCIQLQLRKLFLSTLHKRFYTFKEATDICCTNCQVIGK